MEEQKHKMKEELKIRKEEEWKKNGRRAKK